MKLSENTKPRIANFHPLRAGGMSRDKRQWVLAVSLVFIAGILSPSPSRIRAAGAVEVPVVNAGVGPCTADFTVTDNSYKPVYDAKIHLTVRYGFMNKRKQDLDIGTNSDGKARVEGLPEKAKQPLEYHVLSGDQATIVTQDTSVKCHTNFSVTLGTP